MLGFEQNARLPEAVLCVQGARPDKIGIMQYAKIGMGTNETRAPRPSRKDVFRSGDKGDPAMTETEQMPSGLVYSAGVVRQHVIGRYSRFPVDEHHWSIELAKGTINVRVVFAAQKGDQAINATLVQHRYERRI